MNPAWSSELLMPEERALQERVAEIKPEHTIRGMFIQTTLDLLRKAKGEAAVQDVMAEAELTPDKLGALRKMEFSTFNRVRVGVCKRLAPELGGWEAASMAIGAAAVDDFFESVAGKTMMLLAGNDPHRLMAAAPNGYGLVVDDAGRRSYKKTGERSATAVFTHDLLGPCHEIGTYTAAVKAICGLDLIVHVEQTTILDFNAHCSW